jgi:hypothetical protein
MGLSMSAAMSAIGFSEPLLANLGKQSGKFSNVLPEGQVGCTPVGHDTEGVALILSFWSVVEFHVWCNCSQRLHCDCFGGAQGRM